MGCNHLQAVSPSEISSNNRRQEEEKPPISVQRQSIMQNPQRIKQPTKISMLQSSQQILLQKKDRRKDNLNLDYPYNCIFKLSYKTTDNEQIILVNATGVKVAPNILITAAHFLDGHRTNGKNETITAFPLLPENMHLGYDDFLKYSKQVEFYEYFQDYSDFERYIQKDFGFVKLKSSLNVQDKCIKLGINFNITNYPAQVCGFQGNKQKKMKGLIEEATKEFFSYDIDTMSGQSGSALIVELIKAEPLMVGVHSGFYKSQIVKGKKIKKASFLIQEGYQYRKDQLNSSCRLTHKHLEFLKEKLEEKNCDSFKYIGWQDLQCIRAMTFPSQYYVKSITDKQLHEKQQNQLILIKLKRNASQVQSQIRSFIEQKDSLYSFNKAKSFFKKKRNHQSLDICLRLVKLRELDTIMMLLILNLFGLNYQQLNNFQIAQVFYKRCAKIAENIPQDKVISDSNFFSIIEVFNNLGAIHLEDDQQAARRFLERSKDFLTKNHATQTEHYAAAIINLTVIKLQSKQLQNSQAMENFRTSMQILKNTNGDKNDTIVGKVYVIRHMLNIIFMQANYPEWLDLILNNMELILMMKAEEGVYHRLDDRPINSSQIQQLHRVQYENYNLKIDKNHHLPAYFLSLYQQICDQPAQVFSYYNAFEGEFQLKFCFVFSELSKGLAGKRITKLLTDIVNLRKQSASKQ